MMTALTAVNAFIPAEEARPVEKTAERAATIRPLQPEDLPQVAAIFLKVFRNSRAQPSKELMSYLERLYLGAPWHDPACGSRVHLDKNGVVDGFLGVIQLNMRFENRSLRAGVMGAFMVENREQNRGAGARMLRDFLNAPLDIFFSDTANHISLTFAQKLRFNILHTHSLEWVKILQPSGFGLNMLSRRWPWFPAAPLALLTHGFDATFGRLCRGTDMFRIKTDGIIDAPIGEDDFRTLSPALMAQYILRPDWNRQELSWLFSQARCKLRNGPLHMRAVYLATGELAGIYAFYGKAGGVAQVLNMLPHAGMQDAVVASLLRHADEMGCVAVRGSVNPSFIEGLFRVSGIVYRHAGATVVRTPHKDVADAIRDGKAFFGGLTGESWTRLTSDVF